MDNSSLADNFSLLSKLMDIHGENSFKTRTYSIAAYNIENLPTQLKDTPRDNLFSIKGIGQSIGEKVIEMLESGKLAILEEYIQKTPTGVIEMLNIKGIGPKKALKALVQPVGQIAHAIESKNARFLVELPQIGKRMAELIVAELAGKAGKFVTVDGGAARPTVASTARSPAEEDAIATLMALGERRNDAEHLLDRAIQSSPGLKTTDAFVREMLRLRTTRA